MRRIAVMTSLFAVATLMAAGCNSDGRTLRPAQPGQNASVSTTSAVPLVDDTLAPFPELETVAPVTLAPLIGALDVTAPWADGGAIDARFTCNGANIAPGLSWSVAPAGTAEIADAHRRAALERDAALPEAHPGPRPTGGVAGTRRGVKCLHAHYAWHLAGGDDPVGRWVAARLAEVEVPWPDGPGTTA